MVASRRPDAGLTLIELLVATAIFSLVAAAIATLFRAGIRLEREVSDRQAEAAASRVVLDEVQRVLRNARPAPSSVAGSRDSLRVVAAQVAWSEGEETGWTIDSHLFRHDPEAAVLVRERRSATADEDDDLSGSFGGNLPLDVLLGEVQVDTLARGIRRVDISFGQLDAGSRELQWVDRWTGASAPEAVRVTLGREPDSPIAATDSTSAPPPEGVTRVVRLPMGRR